jgi:hypothetical protein
LSLLGNTPQALMRVDSTTTTWNLLIPPRARAEQPAALPFAAEVIMSG